jgi:AraC-like DNA-binding protein
VREIHLVGLQKLQELLNSSKIRAMELSALSEFQSLPSVGPRFAEDLIAMGFYSLKDLRKKDGAKLTDQHERQIGMWTDPCVEDMFRLVVHLANHPEARKNWWDFTRERKEFRALHGYPATRPKLAWHESEKYKRSAHVKATKKETRKDLAKRLKDSVSYMRKHFGEKISLDQLAQAATLSKYHFVRQFKEVYEASPARYLTRIRLKQASCLLKKTKLPVGQVGRMCGLDNESSFIRLFRKELGATPTDFRNKF